jgi:1,4-dihydroxy-6-naphthoate synthase
MNNSIRTLTLAHSPDSDDAFMFWALARGHIGIKGIEFEHSLSDIQTLNQAALESRYDITAISLHTYPYIAHQYALLNVGASVGDGYGPILVSKSNHKPADIPNLSVAIPGSLTTAALTLRLAVPNVRTRQMTFDTIIDAVKDGEVDAGVIIHEGQLTYKDENLHKVLDLGEWWLEETGLPLPLGANAIKRDLGEDLINEVAEAIRSSINYGFENRTEALGYASDFGGKLERDQVDKFVSMYVNDYTIDWGQKGRSAVQELLKRGADAGIVPAVDRIDFVG